MGHLKLPERKESYSRKSRGVLSKWLLKVRLLHIRPLYLDKTDIQPICRLKCIFIELFLRYVCIHPFW